MMVFCARFHYDPQKGELRSVTTNDGRDLLRRLASGETLPKPKPEAKLEAKPKVVKPEPEPEPERLSDFEIARRARVEAVKKALLGFGITETPEEVQEKQRTIDEERQKRSEEKKRKRMEQQANAEPPRRSLRTRHQPPDFVDANVIETAAAREEGYARVPKTTATSNAEGRVWRRKVRYMPAPPKENMWRVRERAGENWMESLRDYLLEHEELSATNISRVMRQVELMASGRGIANPNDYRGVFMRNRELQVDDDVNELLGLAEEFFDTYGPDYGNGWLVNHPLKKLANFQSHLANNFPKIAQTP